jgi:hypothetical protein
MAHKMLINKTSMEEQKLIALSDGDKDPRMVAQLTGHGRTAPQPQQNALHAGGELSCYASSAVYRCTINSCSAYQRCAQAVSPWSLS